MLPSEVSALAKGLEESRREEGPTEAPSHDESFESPEDGSCTEAAALNLLLKVEREGGRPLPSFLFSPDAVSEICKCVTGHAPISVSMMNEYECEVELPKGITVTTRIAIPLGQITNWFGYPVEVHCTLSTPDMMKWIQREKQSSNLNQTPEQPNWEHKFEVLTQQVIGKVMDHVD